VPLDHMEEMLRTFPLEEEFTDFSGSPRRFRISIRKPTSEDFHLEARDMTPNEGYCFEVYSAVYSAPALGASLGKLRHKIRKGISTRYLLFDAAGNSKLTHDEIRGRIFGDGVVVDGVALHFRDLERILATHEGFEISVKISSSAE
jgi:hypothetical protein